MNKLFTKITSLALGAAMMIGVGVSVSSKNISATEATYSGTSPWSYTLASGDIKTTAQTSKTLNNVTWNIGAATAVNFDSNRGLQIGTGNNPQKTDFTMTAAISQFGSNVGIKSIAVNIATASSGGIAWSLMAGSTKGSGSTGSAGATTTNATKTATYSTAVTSGNVEIKLNSNGKNKAIYLKSITVTFEKSSKTATSTSISAENDKTTLDIKSSPADTVLLTRTISYSGGTLSSPVTWSSSNTDVASISTISGASTTVTAVGKGTTTITASYAGDNTYAQSSGTITITVINSDEKTYSLKFDEGIVSSTGWAGYAAHGPYTYNETGIGTVDFSFESASKQSGTITDYPVGKDGAVTMVLTSTTHYISSVTFNAIQWGDKAQTMNILYSTDGGSNFISAEVSSSTFTITKSALVANTNAIKITFDNSSNQIGHKNFEVMYAEKAPLPTQTITATAESVEVGQSITVESDAAGTVTWSVVSGSGTTAANAAITQDGVITATGAGTVTVKAQASGYADATKQVTFTAPNYSVAVSPTAFTAYRGQSQELTATPTNIAPTKYTWTTTNASVAQLGDNTGSASVETTGSNMNKLTIYVLGDSAGSATITVSATDGTKTTAVASCIITITASTHSLVLSPNTAQTLGVGETVNITATSNGAGYYSSTNVTATTTDASKVKVDGSNTSTQASGSTFTLSGVAVGNATVNFTTTNGDQESISVQVKGSVYGLYTLCTSTDDLVAGQNYIISNSKTNGSAKFASSESNANNRKNIEATVSSNQVDVVKNSNGHEILVVTLGGSSGAWTFQTQNYEGTDGYLASAESGNNNYLRVISTAATATISFSNDSAVINIGPHGSRTEIQYNTSGMFACYSGGQQPVYLYKQMPKVPMVRFTSSVDYLKLVNDTFDLDAEIKNPAGTEGAISFSSDDSSIVQVTNASTGAIKAVGVGSTTIKATATGATTAELPIRVLSTHTGLTANDPLTASEALAFADCLTGDDLEISYYYQGEITQYWSDDTIYEIDETDLQISEPTYAEGLSSDMMVVGRQIKFYGPLQTNYAEYCFTNCQVVAIELPDVVSISFDSESDMTNKTYSSKSSYWKTAGLVVNAAFEDESTMDITGMVEWSFSVGSPKAVVFPSEQTITNYSLTVTATYKGKTASKTVTGITITFDGYEIHTFDGGWTKVTDASSLSAGDQIVIGSAVQGRTAGPISGGYLASLQSDFGTGEISTLNASSIVFTLGGSAGAWTLSNAEGEALGTSAAKSLGWDTGTTTWGISISDGSASITSYSNGQASGYGRLLYNVNSPRFLNYTSSPTASMLLPEIYRKSGVYDVENDLISAIDTFYSSENFTCDTSSAFDVESWNTYTVFTTVQEGASKTMLDKYDLNKIVADENGNKVERFLAMYDYVIGFKKAGGYAGYSTADDFLGRYTSGGIHASEKIAPNSNAEMQATIGATSTAIIIIVSVIGVSALGGFFFLRKRKEI